MWLFIFVERVIDALFENFVWILWLMWTLWPWFCIREPKILKERAEIVQMTRGFPTVWERVGHTVDGPTQIDETHQVCSGFKGQDPPRNGLSRGKSPEPGRTRWTGEQGDGMTLVAACRDVLWVISSEEGSKYDENLGPVIEEAGDLSQPLGEIWTDELPAYQQMEHEHRTVVHDNEYV